MVASNAAIVASDAQPGNSWSWSARNCLSPGIIAVVLVVFVELPTLTPMVVLTFWVTAGSRGVGAAEGDALGPIVGLAVVVVGPNEGGDVGCEEGDDVIGLPVGDDEGDGVIGLPVGG